MSNPVQILTTSKNSYQKNNLINQIYTNDYLLKPTNKANYLSLPKDPYLKTENYFSEIDTEYEQLLARINLGIDGLAHWGNIRGHLEDQTDLINHIKKLLILYNLLLIRNLIKLMKLLILK